MGGPTHAEEHVVLFSSVVVALCALQDARRSDEERRARQGREGAYNFLEVLTEHSVVDLDGGGVGGGNFSHGDASDEVRGGESIGRGG